MELWIRSQDKQVLKLAEHFDIYTGGYDGQEYYVIEESGTDVAQYKTKERALEILDEIQNILKHKFFIRVNGKAKPELLNFLNIENNEYSGGFDNCLIENINNTFVYEMPKE